MTFQPRPYRLYEMWPYCWAVMAPDFLAWIERREAPPKVIGIDQYGQVKWSQPYEFEVIHEEAQLVCKQRFETVDKAAEYVLDFYYNDDHTGEP